jgi:hypothetical protein
MAVEAWIDSAGSSGPVSARGRRLRRGGGRLGEPALPGGRHRGTGVASIQPGDDRRCVDQDHVPRVNLRSFAPEIEPAHVPARLLTNASTSAKLIRRCTGCKVTDPSRCFSTRTSGRRGRYRPSAYRPFSSLLSVAVMNSIRWWDHPTVKGKPGGFGMPEGDGDRNVFCAPHRAFVSAS